MMNDKSAQKVLPRGTKYTTGASRDSLPNDRAGGHGISNHDQSQVLINRYVSSKKRDLRKDVSGERISSIERSSQLAEKLFLQHD